MREWGERGRSERGGGERELEERGRGVRELGGVRVWGESGKQRVKRDGGKSRR